MINENDSAEMEQLYRVIRRAWVQCTDRSDPVIFVVVMLCLAEQNVNVM